jgi:DNA repair exonuclease SbcCD nuclease subunit
VARLVALGDAHLGRTHLAHLRDDLGRNLREEDFLRSFAWAVDTTIELQPDGFLWLGDVFDHARPTYRTFAHVLHGLQRLSDAGLSGVAISGNHDTPRVRGTGSPYDALERVFPNVTFAWRMESVVAQLAGVTVHAVPQTLTDAEFKVQLDATAGRTVSDGTNLVIAHVALTSLPTREWRDINEIEVAESAFDRRFDMMVLGHYHGFQTVSKRCWYAGSTDTFAFSDAPDVPKGVLVLDTETGSVEHVDHPNERRLVTVTVPATGLSPGELVGAAEAAGRGTPDRAIVRIYLNDVDPAAYRQVATEQFQEAVPSALWVQVEPDFGAEALAVQGGPTIGSLEEEWVAYVEPQDLAGLDRDRVRELGIRFLEEAREETV